MQVEMQVNSKVKLLIEGRDFTELFKEMSLSQEVFSDEVCGCCKKSNFKYVHRNVDGNDYYELRCQENNCGARLGFGISKEHRGQIYPKRHWNSLGKEENGSQEQKQRLFQKKYADDHYGYLPNNGWVKWSDILKHNPNMNKKEKD